MPIKRYPRPWKWIGDELRDGEAKTLLSIDPDNPGEFPGVRLMTELIPEMLVLLDGVLRTPSGQEGKAHMETVTREIRALVAKIEQAAK